jgi:hypothetical protein
VTGPDSDAATTGLVTAEPRMMSIGQPVPGVPPMIAGVTTTGASGVGAPIVITTAAGRADGSGSTGAVVEASPLPDGGRRYRVARFAAVADPGEEVAAVVSAPLPLGVDLLLDPAAGGGEGLLPPISLRRLLAGLDDLTSLPIETQDVGPAVAMATTVVLGAVALGASRHWQRRRQRVLAPVRGWQPGSISSFPYA